MPFGKWQKNEKLSNSFLFQTKILSLQQGKYAIT